MHGPLNIKFTMSLLSRKLYCYHKHVNDSYVLSSCAQVYLTFYLVQATTIPHTPRLATGFSLRKPGFDSAESLQLKY